MKKLLSGALLCVALGMSACSVNDMASLGAEILQPHGETARMNQVMRTTGLKRIQDIAEIDQAYFRNHQKEIMGLLVDIEFYRVSEYAFEKLTRAWTRPVIEADERISALQHAVRTYQAPASYEECLEYIGAFNRHGPVNIGCYQSMQRQYTPAQRQQLSQQTRAQFADELARLRKQRSQLHQQASQAGAYSTLPSARKQAGRQRRAIQERLDMHCERLLKAPEVSWAQVQPSASSRGPAVSTAVKGRSDCTYAIFYGFQPHEGFVDTAKLRFDTEYAYQLNMRPRDIRELLRDYR